MNWATLAEAIQVIPRDGEFHAIYEGAALSGWTVGIQWPGYKTTANPERFPNDFYVRVRRPDDTFANFDHIALLLDFYVRNEIAPAEASTWYAMVRSIVVDEVDVETLFAQAQGIEASALRIPTPALLCAFQCVCLEEDWNYPQNEGRRMPLHYLRALNAGVPLARTLRSAVGGWRISFKYLRETFGMTDEQARAALSI